jgi:hypothetical protein
MKASLTYASTFSIVRSEILEGHGVEDIAVKHGIKLNDVQSQVRRLRAKGDMARMFPRKNACPVAIQML